MNMRIFCVAVGLMTASTWAQVPIFKLWVTEVYEVNPDGTYTEKCGNVNCPTQDLLPGIALPGDLINIEVTVEAWDASTDSGECNPEGETCSVSAQDCVETHCSGINTSGQCTEDKDCFPPDICIPDRCEKAPLLGAFQWTIDSSTYSIGGAGPAFAPAQLPCTIDEDCWCAYTAEDGAQNDCKDFVDLSPGFCSCTSTRCSGSVCGVEAAVYIESSPLPNYVFFGHSSVILIDTFSLDYAVGATSLDANVGGVPEEAFRCNASPFATCNVDADCPLGTCEPTARSPYYLGTLLLETTGQSCGLATLDLIQDTRLNEFNVLEPTTTFVNDNNAIFLPIPIVETLIIDLGAPQPCNDGDLCTEFDVFCPPNGECAGTPIVCPPDETCVLGICVAEPGCTFDDLMDATWADADQPAILPFDRPGNCAIDAREPHSINDVNAKEGWDRLVLEFSCDPTDLAGPLRPQRFPVQTDPFEVPPTILGFSSDAVDQTITIQLDRSISPGFYTCISHIGSGNNWCAGYLPADASQDGLSAAGDINALINSINLVPGLALPIFATDINRSGVTTGADILRLIDLLNGAGDFDVWIAAGLPACPSAP